MKKLILAFLLIASTCYAQVAEDVFYEINNFSTLLNSHISHHLIPPGAAEEARNLRANKSVGALSKRDTMLLYGNCGSSPIKSLHRYYNSDTTKHLLVTSSTFLYRGDDDGGTCTTLKSSLSDGKKWEFVTYKDIAIGSNGTDQPIKYDGSTSVTDDTDGHRTDGDLAAELGAPFAELNTGSNLDASSWYQYKIAYYDGTTYSYSSARSNPILTGATVRDITLTDIPLGPSGTTQRIIYRTVGNASKAAVEADTSYYRVATISDNSTRTYDDAVTDATILGDSAPTRATVEAGTNATPPTTKHLLIHKERLFFGNDASGAVSGKSTVYWSDTLNPDYVDVNTDFELIQPDDGGEIMFLENQLSQLVIGKTTNITKFFTDTSSSANWELSTPFSYVGCIAPYSAYPSPIGIIYLGEDGIYTFNGQSSTLISDKVTKEIRDISETALGEVEAVYYKNEYHLAYTSEESGAGANDRVLVLNTIRDSYVIDDKPIDSFTLFNSGDDFGTIYAGSSASDGKIFAQESSPNLYTNRTKSELELATVDSIVISGTETSPTMEIGWGVTIDSTTLSGVTIDSTTYSTAVIDRDDTTGTWWSPNVQINASNMGKLFWNEILGNSGDVTFALRTASTEGGLSSASWSSEFTNPSGSDISGVTANSWVQLRATLTTTDITETPFIVSLDNFVIKMSYDTEGADAETSVLTLWVSGYDSLGSGQFKHYPKRIKEIIVHYEGESGTLSFALDDEVSNTTHSFSIDLSILPDDDQEDNYYGDDDHKVYRHIPSTDANQPVARSFQITITENGVEPWKVSSIIFRYDVEEYYTYGDF